MNINSVENSILSYIVFAAYWVPEQSTWLHLSKHILWNIQLLITCGWCQFINILYKPVLQKDSLLHAENEQCPEE